MRLSTVDAARLLGMKEREVVSVGEVDGRLVATTHDGQKTDIGPVRVTEPVVDEADLVDEERVTEPAPNAARGRRGRSAR